MNVDLVLAENLGHALELLAPGDPDVRPVSGATDAMRRLHAGRLRAKQLVSIFDLPELRGLKREKDGLRVGAATPLTTLLESPDVQAHFPGAIESLKQFASP